MPLQFEGLRHVCRHGALAFTFLPTGGLHNLVEQVQDVLSAGQGLKLLPGESGTVGCGFWGGPGGVFGRAGASRRLLRHVDRFLVSLGGIGLGCEGAGLSQLLFQDLQQVALQHVLGQIRSDIFTDQSNYERAVRHEISALNFGIPLV